MSSLSFKRADTPEGLGRYSLLLRLADSYLGPLWAAQVSTGEEAGARALLRHTRLEGSAREAMDGLSEAAWQALEIRHDNIAAVSDVFVRDDELAVVAELVEGETLRALHSMASIRRKPMSPAVALRIAADILEGLSALHAQAATLGGELYGGLSPDSVLVGTDGCTRLMDVVVAGAATRLEAFATHPERLAYMAPEQLAAGASADARSDVFTVGVLLWEMLSNRRLFIGSDRVVTQKVLSAKIPRLDEVKRRGDAPLDAALVSVVARALHRDLDARFESAEHMLESLRRAGGAPASREEVGAFTEQVAESNLGKLREALERHAISPEAQRREPSSRVSRARRESRARRPEGSKAGAGRGTVPKPGPRPATAPAAGTARAMPTPRARMPTMLGVAPAPHDAARPFGVAAARPLGGAAARPPVPRAAERQAPLAPPAEGISGAGQHEPTGAKPPDGVLTMPPPGRPVTQEPPPAPVPQAEPPLPAPVPQAEPAPPASAPREPSRPTAPVRPEAVATKARTEQHPAAPVPAAALAAPAKTSLAPPPTRPLYSSRIPPPIIHDPRANVASLAPPRRPGHSGRLIVALAAAVGVLGIAVAVVVFAKMGTRGGGARTAAAADIPLGATAPSPDTAAAEEEAPSAQQPAAAPEPSAAAPEPSAAAPEPSAAPPEPSTADPAPSAAAPEEETAPEPEAGAAQVVRAEPPPPPPAPRRRPAVRRRTEPKKKAATRYVPEGL